jgi:hypothetical protein
MKNAKVRKIGQLMNAMFQMQSLERTLTLCFVAPFNAFTHVCSQMKHIVN